MRVSAKEFQKIAELLKEERGELFFLTPLRLEEGEEITLPFYQGGRWADYFAYLLPDLDPSWVVREEVEEDEGGEERYLTLKLPEGVYLHVEGKRSWDAERDYVSQSVRPIIVRKAIILSNLTSEEREVRKRFGVE